MANSTFHEGRHFLQIPGPTNVPDRVLRAMNRPTIDHRGPEFASLTLSILGRLKQVFNTTGPVVMFPSSGTGAWEAALVNTLSAGDGVLMYETGQFAQLWRRVAERIGLVSLTSAASPTTRRSPRLLLAWPRRASSPGVVVAMCVSKLVVSNASTSADNSKQRTAARAISICAFSSCSSLSCAASR